MMADGIYLNLAHETHIADPAIGGSDMGDLLVNPVQWHGHKRNPTWRALLISDDPQVLRRQLNAKLFGEAFHCIALEPAEFGNRFFVPPPAPDWPDTKGKIRLALEEFADAFPGTQLPPKSVDLDAHKQAARRFGIPIADDWDVKVKEMAGERIVIPEDWNQRLTYMGAVLERHSQARKFLSHGRSEVSVFWTDEHGDRYRVRFDYLRVRTVSEVKTYAYREGEDPIATFCGARDRFGYGIAAAHIMDARMNVLPDLVGRGLMFDAGRPDGNLVVVGQEDREFLHKVADYTDPRWWWIACSTGGVPEVDTIEFPKELMAFAAARVQLDQAKANYRRMRATFGPDDSQMWIEDRGLVRLTEFNHTRRFLDRGVVLHETIEP